MFFEYGRSMWCCVRFKENRTDIMIQDSVSIICAVVFRRSSPQNFTFTRLRTHSLSVQKRRHHEALLSAAFSRRSTSLIYLSGYDGGCIILSPKAYCLSNQTFCRRGKHSGNFEPFLLAYSPIKPGTLAPFLAKCAAIQTTPRDKHRIGGAGGEYLVAKRFLFS